MKWIYSTYIIFWLIVIGCDDFVQVDKPKTELIKSSVFEDAGTAEAAVVELYRSIRDGFGGGDQSALTALTALSSDELELFINDYQYEAFNDNEVLANNLEIESLWGDFYRTVYQANAIVEGLTASDVALPLREQLRGEAVFIRCFAYFYLVNLWGDVPLTITTDYSINAKQARTSATDVYQQIVADLKECQVVLPDAYIGERVRVNKSAATAFLARVYLYLKDWNNAEAEASKVIGNELYALEADLGSVFRTSSKEAILQLWHSTYPREYVTFLVIDELGGPIFASLSPAFIQSFSPDDLRYIEWISKVNVAGIDYWGVWKYKSNDEPPIDYSTTLRLAEQYLIRAEARIQLDKLSEAVSDLNMIRARAGLPDIPVGTKSELLDAVYLERKHELFSEQGHRWLDLKRTGRVNEVLSALKPFWDNEDSLYPIPESQIVSNPAITQNP